MGLDMYLNGRKFLYGSNSKSGLEDGFPISERILDLGYWRKHPDLHGYIVQAFANGVDECQVIPLDARDLKQILGAVEAETLPHTEGFFFGESDPSRKPETLAILKRALEWLETDEADVSRSVIYRASW